jgi:cytochrome c biogenesis protein CcmG, thiol:disulfide interchange protein DsbE
MMRVIPLTLLIAFLILGWFSLQGTQQQSTSISPWIGQTAPDLRAEQILPASHSPLIQKNTVTMISFFASWCAPCIAEHPLLSAIAASRKASIIGVAWHDAPEAIKQFLSTHGNPYARVYHDTGSAALALGIRGVPETFIIDREGIIRFHSAGPLTDAVVRDTILPLLNELNP